MNMDEMNLRNEETGRPMWFKVWPEKYVTALDLGNLDEDLTAEEREVLFTEVGKAFINGLLFFQGEKEVYTIRSRDGKIVWNNLKQDIKQAFRDYEKRVEDGKKGGRPPKTIG